MKKMYTQPVQFLRLLLPAAVCFCYALAPHTAAAQSYYSDFVNTNGMYSVTQPSGGTCKAPFIQNSNYFADANTSNYTTFSGTITAPLTCTNSNYTFRTLLLLPADTAYARAGVLAGFSIEIPTHIDPAKLTANLSVQTFLNGTLADNLSGSDIHLIDLATDSVDFIVYGKTTMNFNEVQLTVNDQIIPLNLNFTFGVEYGFSSNTDVLPVTMANYRAKAAGNNVAIAWQSLNETNISSYRIEKSSNNGVSYTTVATLPARGNGNAITYNYTDKAIANGNYLYRVVAIDKDGTFKATNAILVTISGKTYLTVMPSIVKPGQAVVINSGLAGNYQIAVYDIQGRMVKQQQVNNSDKATINTSGLSAGTYVVKITSASGNVSQAKFIVN